jgi:hypothetical protein
MFSVIICYWLSKQAAKKAVNRSSLAPVEKDMVREMVEQGGTQKVEGWAKGLGKHMDTVSDEAEQVAREVDPNALPHEDVMSVIRNDLLEKEAARKADVISKAATKKATMERVAGEEPLLWWLATGPRKMLRKNAGEVGYTARQSETPLADALYGYAMDEE